MLRHSFWLLLIALLVRLSAAGGLHEDVELLSSGEDGLRLVLRPQIAGEVDTPRGRHLRVDRTLDAQRPLRRLLVVVPPGRSARASVLGSSTESRTGPFADAGFTGANPSPILTYRTIRWSDLDVMQLDVDLLRANDERASCITSIEIEIEFAGTRRTGYPSTVSEGERTSLLLNGDLAGNWASHPPMLFRDGEAGWDGSDWIRIPVTEEGIYRITPADLSAQGLDPGLLDPATFKLYSYGGRMIAESPEDPRNNQFRPLEVPMLRETDGDGAFSGSDRVLFYGRGVSGLESRSSGDIVPYGNFYADANQYLLLVGGSSPGRQMETLPAPAAGAMLLEQPRWRMVLDEGLVSAEHSTRGWYMAEFGQEGAEWMTSFPAPLAGGTELELEFDFAPPLSMPSDWIEFTVNGETMEDRAHPHDRSVAGELVLQGDELRIGLERVTWTGLLFHLDWLMPTFEAPARFVEDEIRFETPGITGDYEVRIQSAPASYYLFDVTHHDSIRVSRSGPVGASVVDSDTTPGIGYPRLYYGASEQGLRSVSSLQRVVMPDLAADLGSARMIVVAPDVFSDAAREFVELKNNLTDMSTRLVLLEDIYQKYNCGIADPGALRNYLRQEVLESADPADFVLFVGNGHYDYRGQIAGGFPLRMPAWYRYSTSRDDADPMIDDFFVRLLSHDHLDMAYGRLPANSEADVRAYTDKVEQYLSSQDRDLWRNRLLLVADDEYGENHLVSSFEFTHSQDSEVLASQYVPEAFQVERLYLFDFPSIYNPEIRVYEKPQAERRLVDAINEGVALVNFMGHGNNNTWTHEYVFTSTKHLPLLERNGRPTFYVAATCSWAEIDLPIGLAMPQQLIHLESGGAIGIVAATRKTGGTSNDNFVRDLMPIFFSNGEDGARLPLGEALRRAKNVNYDTNRQKYIYLGDPSLQPPFPEFPGTLTRLESGGMERDSLLAGALTRFVAQTGDPIPPERALEGLARVEMRQPPVARQHDYAPYSNSSQYHNVSLQYKQPGSLLFSGPITMSGGSATGSFFLPVDVPIQAESGKLRVYMVGDAADGRVHDALVYHEVMIAANADPITDVDEPRLQIFLNGPQWREDDLVAPNSILYVLVEDSSGVNLSGDIGHRIEVGIDGGLPLNLTSSFEYDLDSYRRGKAGLSLPQLDPGEHTVTARAFDNAGNPGYAEGRFHLLAPRDLKLAEVLCTPNPVQQSTRFSFLLEGVVTDEIREMELSVYTVRGRRVTQETLDLESGGGLFWSEEWRPRNDLGQKLARGAYLYRIRVRVPEIVYSLAGEDGTLQVNRISPGSVEGQGKVIVD